MCRHALEEIRRPFKSVESHLIAGVDFLKSRVTQVPEASLADDLASLAERWRAGEMGAAGFAAATFLLWQMDRHGRGFASRLSRSSPKPELSRWRETLLTAKAPELEATLAGWFEHYRFFRIIPAVPIALSGWLQRGWPLRLISRIPSPREVLHMQASGMRPVTVFEDYARASQTVLTKASGFDFLVHDLEHAWKFCNDPAQYRAQRGFFGLLELTLAEGIFGPYLDDALFAAKFDYLISDMNTHPVHGLRFLHAVLIECLLRREDKAAGNPLSPLAREEVTSLMQGLAEQWRLSRDGSRALHHLAECRFSEEDARNLEQALLERATPQTGG